MSAICKLFSYISTCTTINISVLSSSHKRQEVERIPSSSPSSQFIAYRSPVCTRSKSLSARRAFRVALEQARLLLGSGTLIPEESQDRRAYHFLRGSSSLRGADAKRDSTTTATSRAGRTSTDDRRKKHRGTFR